MIWFTVLESQNLIRDSSIHYALLHPPIPSGDTHGRAGVPVPGVREDVRSAVDAAGAYDHPHQDVQLHVPALPKGDSIFDHISSLIS